MQRVQRCCLGHKQIRYVSDTLVKKLSAMLFFIFRNDVLCVFCFFLQPRLNAYVLCDIQNRNI